MALNRDSVVGFVLKELGYAEGFAANIIQLAETNGPEVEATISAVQQAITTDSAAFAAHQAVTSPSVGASVSGGAYKVTVVFTPA